jgi:toxin YoeB
MYTIDFSDQAKMDLAKLKRNEPNSFKKASKLLIELAEHPQTGTGTGKPKPLGNDRAGLWSRKITDKHRLVYRINDDRVEILVLSTYGHYSDK